MSLRNSPVMRQDHIIASILGNQEVLHIYMLIKAQDGIFGNPMSKTYK